jgi:hypothetical protein
MAHAQRLILPSGPRLFAGKLRNVEANEYVRFFLMKKKMI